MKKLTMLCLLTLLSGCANTGSSDGCAGPGGCPDAKQQIMSDAVHYHPFGG